MPTGYTADLYDGKPQTFEEFALTCARNFGALIDMRDMGLGAAIPDEIVADDWYQRELDKATARLAEVQAMTLLDCAAAARTAFEAWETEVREQRLETEARRRRYEDMREQALAWHPPTDDHTGLRDFMVQQIDESLRFDCTDFKRPEPTRDGVAWREQEVDKALRDIEYRAKALAEARQRAAERNAWLKALRESLR